MTTEGVEGGGGRCVGTERHRRGGKEEKKKAEKRERRKRQGAAGQGHVSGVIPSPQYLPACDAETKQQQQPSSCGLTGRFIVQRGRVKMQTKRGAHCHTLYASFYSNRISVFLFFIWPPVIRRKKHYLTCTTRNHLTSSEAAF